MKRFLAIVLNLILFFKSAIQATEIFKKLIEEHPQIKAIQSEVYSKYYEAQHEGVYPDPKLGVAFRNYPYTGRFELQDNRPNTPGMTGIEYGISQEIPYFSKLPKTKQLKFLEYQQAKIFYEIEFNTLSVELLKNLIEFQSSENIIQLLNSYLKILESIQKTSQAEYLTGKKQLGSISKIHIDKLSTKESILEWNFKKTSSLSKLQYFSIEPNLELEEILKFPYIHFLENLEKELEKQDTLSDIPVLQEAELALKKAHIEKELGKLEHLPETEVFLSYMKRNRPSYMFSNGIVSTLKGNWEIMDYNEFRGDLFSFGVNIRIPVWSIGKIKDLNLSNEFKTKKAEFDLIKIKKLFQSQVQSEKAELESLSKQILFMEKEHMQSLIQNLNSLKSNYQTSKAGFTEVLFAQGEILNLKIQIENFKARKLQKLASLLGTYGIYSKIILQGK